MEHELRGPFAAAVEVATDLVLSPEVEARWQEESACADMSVGALARHLVSQWFNAERLLRAPAGEAPIPVVEHYLRAAWVSAGHDDEANVQIRRDSEVIAAEGPDSMRVLVGELEPRLAEALASDRRGPVLVPWQGWSLSEHDFLLTRLIELVVHSDDLAASIDVTTPDFPDDVVTPVLGLLTDVAIRRHGQWALVRALARPQRASRSISAF
ncbi:MAG TPA: maleylpyruvate isomerase N-terminal domain-containing protein [Nocardioides sp.]|uniref:maleylpyruvate isomerase N-terminal domain-containing protein n=1 Tax=Nocardioides sp. TaxID=35761 RepID=UPI002F40E951